MSGKTDHVGVTTMDRLDQGHLHPLLEQPKTDMSQPGIERRPPQRESSTIYIAKSYSNSLLIARCIYMSPRQSEVMAPEEPSVCGFPESRLSTNKHSIAQCPPLVYS